MTGDNVLIRREGTLLTDSSNTVANDQQRNINNRINNNMVQSWHGAQARGYDHDGLSAPYPSCNCDAP